MYFICVLMYVCLYLCMFIHFSVSLCAFMSVKHLVNLFFERCYTNKVYYYLLFKYSVLFMKLHSVRQFA